MNYRTALGCMTALVATACLSLPASASSVLTRDEASTVTAGCRYAWTPYACPGGLTVDTPCDKTNLNQPIECNFDNTQGNDSPGTPWNERWVGSCARGIYHEDVEKIAGTIPGTRIAYADKCGTEMICYCIVEENEVEGICMQQAFFVKIESFNRAISE